ncbi:non-ribosomal peptide synthetase [Aerolutibacter daejeonensis]|uniref:non-ribosomal peptide synthetase n=1 Tax=Aerolutibacter daejeonensis TaxID=346181 RepID=UPI000692020E|nr:non-ribosomal peptide synthetase [Lysobacter daejeonensis]
MSTVAAASSPALEPVDYNPFEGGELSLVVPTTESQQEIWLADQLGADASLSFNLSVSLRMTGPLDVDALKLALQDLVDRHDALRANLAPGGRELCIRDRIALQVDMLDLANLSQAAQEELVSRQLLRSVETPFALAVDLLFRAELLRLGQHDHILVLTAHHAICDGWSWWVLVRELGALYGSRLGLPGEALPEPAQFSDYALSAKESRQDGKPTADEAYWVARFPGPAPILELPTDHPRPPVRTFASARVDHVFDEQLLSMLRRAGARRGASLFATLLAGWSGLLARLTAQTDIVVGIPAAGQPSAGHDDLVGHCVNTLPLRFDVDASQGFGTLVDVAQRTLLDALEHQSCTFGTLLTKLRIPRDPARMPLVSVLFNLDQALDQQSTAFAGMSMEFDSNPRRFETFELFLNAVQAKGTLRLECQYNTDLFDRATIERWLGAYETLLRGAVQADAVALERLPLVDAFARAELDALQPAPTAYDAGCGMHQFFERQCDRTPAHTAIIAGGGQWTYAELEAKANRIAHVLRAGGVKRGALVGLALDRGVDMVAAMLAILKTGAGYVPLDPAFPSERLAYMAADAGLAMLVTTSDHAERFDLRGRPLLVLDQQDELVALAANTRLEVDAAAAKPEDAAYVIYTSGSTGRPKGVVVPHRSVSNFLSAMRAQPGLRAQDRLLAITTLSFDIAVLELLLPLSVGASVVIADHETASDGAELLALLGSCGATVMQGTPSSWRLLLDAGWSGASGFKALCGGEPMPPDLAAELVNRCGSVWNVYGPTETTVWSTSAHIVASVDGGLPDVHIGTPIANTSIWILDAHGELCPRGVPGEICIGGQGVTKGYLNRSALTEERFVADQYTSPSLNAATPEVPALLYRTGDRGRWRHDGHLEHLGRLDTQVKVRGYRIELGEIEANLASRPEVGRALVIVREDRPGDQRLVAYLVAAPGKVVDEATLRTHLRGLLPAYMLPQHFVVLDAIPHLPNGKVDRAALPAPASSQTEPPATDTPTAEADPRVRYLAEVWTELLGVPATSHDNFFELGGHSMLAVQMAARVERETGHRIKLIRLGVETLEQVAFGLPHASEARTSTRTAGTRLGSGLRRLLGMASGASDEH